MLYLPLVLLGSGYIAIIALTAYLVSKWMAVPEKQQGPRFRLIRRLNIMAILLACLAAMALITGYYFGGRITFVGIPIVLLLFLSSGSPRRFANQ